MMKALRKNYKTIFWILAVLIIPPFVWWGAGSYSEKGKAPSYAGTIGKIKVSFNEYRAVYLDLSRSLGELFGSQLPENLLQELTWTRLLLIQEAKNRGIKVSDQEVRARIEQFSHFQKGGHFDPVSYQQALGDRARVFEEGIRQELLLQKLRETTTAGVSLTEEETRSEYTKENEKIQISYALIPVAKNETTTSNDPTALNASPSEETQKEREAVRQKANQIHQELEQKIQSGISPADAFNQTGLSVTHTEPLTHKGVIGQMDHQPSLMDAAFGTTEGKLGPMIEVSEGFCFFWTEKKISIAENRFQTEKANFQKQLLEKKKSDAFNQWIAQLRDKTPIKNALTDLQN
jgi:hypothetical protein